MAVRPIDARAVASMAITLARRRKGAHQPAVAPESWRAWLALMFPDDPAPPAWFHAEMWDWLWSLERGERPVPFAGIWPRGAAKSTNAERACVAAGALKKRRYALYVSGSQQQANAHVEAIATLLESSEVGDYYPGMGARRVMAYGRSRGWRQDRLATASGFTVDAVGLDVGVRGRKMDADRPDLIILDDLDEESDTPDITKRKIRRLTRSVLPAGTPDTAVLAVQNVVLSDGIFAQLAGLSRQPTTFLLNRRLSGPVPAINDLQTEVRAGRHVITGGEATWEGLPVAACQAFIDAYGFPAFMAELQHRVRERGSKLFDMATWDNQHRFQAEQPPGTMVARVIGWDTGEATGDTAAYTAAVVLEVRATPALPWRYIVCVREVYRGRWGATQLRNEIPAYATLWHRDRKLRHVPVENASFGKAVIPQILQVAPPWLRSMITPIPPVGSKDARLGEAAGLAADGRLWLPFPGPSVDWWLSDFEAELEAVPGTLFRDQTDALAHAVHSPWVRRYMTAQGAG